MPFNEPNQTIQEITSLTAGFMPAQIVLTANRLDLFSHLSGKTLTARKLAKEIGCDPNATERLCNALTALGFLYKNEEGAYKNAPKSEAHLVRGRSYYIGDSLRLQSKLWQSWSALEDVIRTGKPARKERTKDGSRQFTLAMANIGQLSARQVAEGLDLRGVRRMLDLGGGPGVYAEEFVRKNPDIHATIFDVPDVVEVTRERIRDSAQLSTIAGDCFEDDLGADYDLVFMSNFIHIFALNEIIPLFNKVRKALNPRGRLVIKDFFMNDQHSGPVFSAQFALHMLVNTETGNTYSFPELRRALQEAEFRWLNSFTVAQHSTVIVAERT